jgi:hypothetical protein
VSQKVSKLSITLFEISDNTDEDPIPQKESPDYFPELSFHSIDPFGGASPTF